MRGGRDNLRFSIDKLLCFRNGGCEMEPITNRKSHKPLPVLQKSTLNGRTALKCADDTLFGVQLDGPIG